MRSRYSAFALQNAAYILETQSDQTASKAALEKDLSETRYTNLIVIETKRGRPYDKTGEVTFVAAYRPAFASADERAGQIHECSQFAKVDGRWIYTTGKHLPAYQTGRNEPCWCGSGKKTKKCCG